MTQRALVHLTGLTKLRQLRVVGTTRRRSNRRTEKSAAELRYPQVALRPTPGAGVRSRPSVNFARFCAPFLREPVSLLVASGTASRRGRTGPARCWPSLSPNALELAELIADEPQLAEEIRRKRAMRPHFAKDARCSPSRLLSTVPKEWGPVEVLSADLVADRLVAANHLL